MSDADQQAPPPEAELPPSVNQNIGTIAEFYARHEEHASATQKVVEKIARFLGSPVYVFANVVFIACWIVGNLLAEDFGRAAVDEPPFFWLQGLIGLNAFVISTTVLIRQNRMARLAEHHAHLDLQVNLLTEEKTSKIIALLDELRRDLPYVRDKTDHEAQAMSRHADAKAVLSAIERGQGDCS